MASWSRLASAAVGLAALVAGARSDPAHAGALAWSNQLALRHNPLGLRDERRLGYRTKLGEPDPDSVLFGKTFLFTGAMARVSPQFVQGGASLTILPIAVFELDLTSDVGHATR